jgi:hypothetical protein
MKDPNTTRGKDWEGWSVEDGELEYYIDIEDRTTARVSVMAPEWWDAARFLVKTVYGENKPLFEINNPELVRLIDRANEYFDAHGEDDIDQRTEARIRQIILRELRKRGIK